MKIVTKPLLKIVEKVERIFINIGMSNLINKK